MGQIKCIFHFNCVTLLFLVAAERSIMINQTQLFKTNNHNFQRFMTQNIIQIKPILNHQITQNKYQIPLQTTKVLNNKGSKQNVSNSPIDYLQPKNYPFFKKEYVSAKNGIDCQTIVYDMTEYIDLLSNEQKKVAQQMNRVVNQKMLEPLYKIVGFYSQLAQHAQIIIEKIVRVSSKMATQLKKMPNINEEQLNKRIYCQECKTEIIRNQILNLKNDLQLRDFEDKYDFYKIDAIKLYEMRKIKNYSHLLVKSELGDQARQMNLMEKTISLEQFEEILNLFGSDIHKKNKTFQFGIGQINQLCQKIEEENINTSVDEKELREFEFFVGKKEINEKLSAIFKRFFNKYNKMKAEKRRDADTQANIKQSEVIKQLQKEKKDLKMKLYRMEAQKIKQNQQYTKTIEELKIQVSALVHQNQQNNTISQYKFYQYQKRLAEQKVLVQLLRKQIQNQNAKYAHLQMEYLLMTKGQRTESKNSKKKKTLTKRSTDVNVKKQHIVPQKLKKQNNIQSGQIGKSFTENIINNEISQSNIRSQKRLLNSSIKNSSRNTSIMSKKSLIGENNDIQAQKYVTYESIEQKRQQQQSDDLKKLKSNKVSRFRVAAGLSRFNNESLQTPTHNSPNIYENKFRKYQKSQKGQNEQQQIKKEKSFRSSENQSAGVELYQTTLKKLYDYQMKKAQLQDLSFDDFTANYEKFIKEINSQKQFNNNDLNQSKEKHDLKQKKQHIHLSLSRVQSLKDSTNIQILRKKQTNKSEKQIKKSIKLEPLLRKTNYYLHKNKKNFSAYESKFAISACTSLQQSKIQDKIKQPIEVQRQQLQKQKIKLTEKIDKEKIIQPEQIVYCFGGKQNIAKYYSLLNKNEEFVMNVQENQFIMNGMTLLAQLHFNNPHSYQYIKKVIMRPSLWTYSDFQENDLQESKISLQNALKAFIILHRDCKIQNKDKNCNHLQILNSLIYNFVQSKPQQAMLKKQKIKKCSQKKLSRKKSLKESTKNV